MVVVGLVVVVVIVADCSTVHTVTYCYSFSFRVLQGFIGRTKNMSSLHKR